MKKSAGAGLVSATILPALLTPPARKPGCKILGLALFFLLLRPGAALQAGGPLVIKDGVPRHWSTNAPIDLNLDRGPLGGIPNAVAISIVEHAMGQWNGVSTSQLRLRIGEALSTDVEGLSKAQFDNFTTKDDGTVPVLFDSTGEMFDALFGPGNAVIGVAGPSLIVSSSGTIVKGFAMFNGAGATMGRVETFKAVVTHELGHMLNLQHSQINGVHLGSPIPGFSGSPTANDVETMYPVLISSSAVPHPMATLHKDDIAAISALYPTGTFSSTTASITGTVFDIDGATPLEGVNVVARNVDRPFEDAVSYVSGSLADPPSPSIPRSVFGSYELLGLSPGADYKIYIEEVDASFQGGARVGPLDPPLDIDSDELAAFLEFWSGASESADNPPDDPLQAEMLKLGAGSTASRVDFIFNGVKPRLEGINPSSGIYSSPRNVSLSGANLVGAFSVHLEDPDKTEMTGLQVVNSGLLRAVVPAGVLPGEYPVVVTTTKGSSDPGPVVYEVTEPLPTVISAIPDSIPNDRPQEVVITGTDLLGTKSAQMEKSGGVVFDLKVLERVSASRIVVEVPAGVLPGDYKIHVTNTAGTSPLSLLLIRVVELAPVLSADTKPRSAANSTAKQVRIQGQNLTGTRSVELVNGATSVPLIIVSTSLSEVVVTVPGGLEPGVYLVRVTNSTGAVTGPATFKVKNSSGGGGGCGGTIVSGGPHHTDLPILLSLLFLGGWLRSGIRCKDLFRRRPCPA
jgi:hypothetical protein